MHLSPVTELTGTTPVDSVCGKTVEDDDKSENDVAEDDKGAEDDDTEYIGKSCPLVDDSSVHGIEDEDAEEEEDIEDEFKGMSNRPRK